jgi:hypothetical protein
MSRCNIPRFWARIMLVLPWVQRMYAQQYDHVVLPVHLISQNIELNYD